MGKIAPQLLHTPCGLPLVHQHRPGAASGIFGVIVGAGSAADDPDCHGLAHFVEHTIFKGTHRRRSWHIINRMEAIGGELNAYTTKEETVVYSVFPGNNAARAAELIADLVANSQFPEKELEKERDVVLDEIDTYADNPGEAIFDLFEENIFAASPLAHNILGSEKSVKSLSSADCRRFLATNYTKCNMVAFYSGAQSAAAVEGLISRFFDAVPAGTGAHRTCAAPVVEPFEIQKKLPCHQAHVMAGVRCPDMHSPQRHAIALLANITGGPGMNSLLNVELREKRGLVYNVETSTSLLSTAGYWAVYLGCDASDVEQCLHLCRKVFAGIADGTALTPRRLAMAKKQFLGQMAVAAGNRENTVIAAARCALFRGHLIDPAETRLAIEAVTSGDLSQQAAAFAAASTYFLLPAPN